jgi:molybdenum cofactor synthesis domain-containing protein
MSEETIVKAAVIIIGNEVLSGRTREANLQFLASALGKLGIRVAEARVVADEEDAIVDTVNACRRGYSYVFTTGGIGPTHDDITAAAVAKAFGVPLIRHDDAERRLREHYAAEDLNNARLRMAEVPEGSTLLDNPVSGAPGFQIGNVFVLPGVPRIMQAMFIEFCHRLVGGAPMLSRSITAHALEGTLASPLASVQARHPGAAIGSYPFVRDGRVGTVLVVRSSDPAALAAAADNVRSMLDHMGVQSFDEASY